VRKDEAPSAALSPKDDDFTERRGRCAPGGHGDEAKDEETGKEEPDEASLRQGYGTQYDFLYSGGIRSV